MPPLRLPFAACYLLLAVLLLLHLQRILHVIEFGDFGVPELAVDLLDLADVDRLHDVAGLGIGDSLLAAMKGMR